MDGRLTTAVRIASAGVVLDGDLTLVPGAAGLVVFVHGSGSSRHSPRNRAVAGTLLDGGLSTLLFDLLTHDEELADQMDAHLRFDIALLTERLRGATVWLREQPQTKDAGLGFFGASTGAAAALVAAAAHPEAVFAIVSRGGRPDLAGQALAAVRAPTLFIVGGDDTTVLELNRQAMAQMHAPVHLEIVPGATHLFEEPGALERVATRAAEWFTRHLT